MAFRRKDVKKASYYVWFLGARESAGLRGEQFILPVLAPLLRQERLREPVKVTLQVSSKGLKIVQNVCRSKESKPAQVKHVIPAASITCALQSEDVVSVVLLLFNPLTGCPVHVHAYRCDSLATAFGLRSQLQTLIERPENQRKFSEIEARLAAKGLMSEQHMNKHSRVSKTNDSKALVPSSAHHLQHASLPLISLTGGPVSHSNSGRLPIQDKNRMQSNLKALNDPLSRQMQSRHVSNQHTLNSDGRSAAEDESSEDASGSNGSNSERDGRSPVDPMVAVMYESLAAELKAKLGNPEVAPILLPPRDYDTVCRSRGQVLERTDRKCTNRLLIGGPTMVDPNAVSKAKSNKGKSSDSKNVNEKVSLPPKSNVIPTKVTDNSKPNKSTVLPINNVETSDVKAKEPVKPPRNRGAASLAQQEAGCEEIIQKTDQVRKSADKSSEHPLPPPPNVSTASESNRKADDQLDSCAQVQVHSQVRLERLRAEKAKVAAKLEQLEQMEQLERATAESARKHAINQLNRTASIVDLKANKSHKSNKCNGDTKRTEQLNPKLITQHGLKQIGSLLANKICQTLFVSSSSSGNGSAGKQSPQLIRHQMLHSSQPDLRLPSDLPAKVMKTQTLEAPIAGSNKTPKAAMMLLTDGKCLPPLESLQSMDGKRSSASSGKSASSGIGSSRLAMNSFEDELGFASTDEELELEMLRRGGSASGSGGSAIGTADRNAALNGEWRNRRAAVRSMSNLAAANVRKSGSRRVLDEGLDEEEDEYFINDELELDERPLHVRQVNVSSDEEHSNAIRYDDNLMPQIDRTRSRKRATSVESAVRSATKACPSTQTSAGCKSIGRDLDEVDLLQHVESLPPVSRQACLRRSETCVGSTVLSSAQPIKRGQSTTHLLSIPTNVDNAINATRSNEPVVKPKSSKRHSSVVPMSHQDSQPSHPERSFFYPHVPNGSPSARRHSHHPHQALELKRQVSTPSLLHSHPMSMAGPSSSTGYHPHNAYGPRSAISNNQLHLLSAQPFRLRSKPLHGFVSGF
jgi:hypothetical protein